MRLASSFRPLSELNVTASLPIIFNPLSNPCARRDVHVECRALS